MFDSLLTEVFLSPALLPPLVILHSVPVPLAALSLNLVVLSSIFMLMLIRICISISLLVRDKKEEKAVEK